jgi:predicted nucleic acid-binding protein
VSTLIVRTGTCEPTTRASCQTQDRGADPPSDSWHEELKLLAAHQRRRSARLTMTGFREPPVMHDVRMHDVCGGRIKGQSLAAPDLLCVGAVSVICCHLANGALTTRQATNAIEDLLNLPIVVYPTAALLHRVWELRDNVTAYDACYVALAEALGCSLATADQRLANAPGTRCQFDIV